MMRCPLCDHLGAKPSWLGVTLYRGKEFPYVECLFCRSLYCNPTPDRDVLAQMYGSEYFGQGFDSDLGAEENKEPLQVIKWLKKLRGGTFVDYGCGSGALLTEAKKLNWRAIGLEFDEQVARAVEAHTGATVVSGSKGLIGEPLADVLHLGDVIEHLTEMNHQMPEILRLLKPGGLLLAQGPLEANANLFALILRCWKTLRFPRPTEMPPYHVVLATAQGQRLLFKRLGLEEIEYSIREVSWPAPNRLSRLELTKIRSVVLVVLRRLSQRISALQPHRWGNRYFYVGRWNGQSAIQR